jgi:hypothetical protein
MCVHESKAIGCLNISPVTIQIRDRYGVAPRLVMSAPGVTKKSVMIDGWKTVTSQSSSTCILSGIFCIWFALLVHTGLTRPRHFRPHPCACQVTVNARLQEHVVEYLDDMLEPEETLGSEPIGDASRETAASTQRSGRKREVFAA